MIKSISLQNFQSHKDSTLEFSDGVNVILGASDSGKTAIIRALRWVAFHKPSGDEMRSHWGGKTSVEVVTDDAIVVKSKDKEQEYVLGDTHFKAFGTEVPQEIKEALNLDSINLQSQLDQPFLLSDTPGAVASHFNKVAHLEKIDFGLQNINSWIRQLSSDINYKQTDIDALIEKLTTFEHLEKFEVQVEVLEGMDKLLVKTCANSCKLGKLLETHQVNGETILEYKEILLLEEPLNQIFKWKDERKEIDLDRRKLSNLYTRIDLDQYEIEKQTQILSIEVPVNDLLKLYKDLNNQDSLRISLSKAIKRLESIKGQLISANALHLSLQAKFEKAMPIGSICLLCGQEIKK